MGNTRRKQVRGRWAGWAAPAPCRPGTRAMGPREAADGGQVAGGLGVREVRVRYVLARRRAQPHVAAREVPPPPLGDGRDGHAAPRGAPAPLVPCHVAAGEVEGGRVRPRARRPGRGLGEHGDPRAGAPARRHGEIGVSPTCCRAGSRRTTSSSPRATGRGGAGRRGPRTRGRCSRRPGAPRAGAGASLPTARHVISNLESWATGTSRGLSTAGPWSPTAAWGATAATSCAGRSSARSPRPARPGASGRRGEVPITCDYEAHWGALQGISIQGPLRDPDTNSRERGITKPVAASICVVIVLGGNAPKE